MTVVDLIGRNARMHPNRIAYVEVRPVSRIRREITWSEFYARVNRISQALAAKGIRKGMKVALLGKNSIHWLESFFGILATGAWAIPLNFRFTQDDIIYCAGIAEPSAFIMDEEYEEGIAALKEKLPTVHSFFPSVQIERPVSRTLKR